jgi:hypothetical protein
MNFEAFFDFLNSLYFEEVEIATRTSNQERIARMVFTGNFGNDITNQQETDSNRRQAMRTARCVKILGKGVVKVVHRCDDAKENHNLDLSDCQLMQVPDAVYHLMRSITLNSCNLSGNVISKIPPKFAISFNLIKDLNLSNNRISTLPEEMNNCTALETINISQNSFISIPNVIFSIPTIKKIDAKKNFIADVDAEIVKSCSALEDLNLEENPVSSESYDKLKEITSITITLTARKLEEWEDLSV